MNVQTRKVAAVLNKPSWEMRSVGKTLKLINGFAFKPTDWSEEGLPIVRIQNLNNPDAPFNRTLREIPEKYRLHGGELLFAWSGTPGTSFGAHIWRGRDAWLNQHIFKVDFDKYQWDIKFLQLAINLNLSDYIRAAHGGAGLAHITKKKFEESLIIHTNLGDQRCIVAEIEKQFTRLDAGIAALKRVQANLKRYRAAVLKAACEGHLVPTEAELARAQAGVDSSIPGLNRGSISQSSDRVQAFEHSGLTSPTIFETGEQLLQRILTERRQNWQGRGSYKEPALHDITGLPPLPDGWAWSSVDQLSHHITSGSRDWSQFYGRGKGTFVLAQNIRPMRLDLTERQSVEAPRGDAETERTRVRQNDILITIVGAKTGDICRVPMALEEHYICQSVALVRMVKATTAKYLELYLASPENGQAIWKRFIYGQGRPHLGFDQLRATAVALPPLAEQARIVAEVERRLSVVEELGTLVQTNLQCATCLRQSILQKAFSGTLV